MIISRLSAENFLKYKSLILDNLPQQGVIAISGENESGKSSIGEAICFALFGRTWMLEAKDRTRAIYWGEKRAKVSLRFIASDGVEYEVTRQLESDGNQGAKLEIPGSEVSLARGVNDVDLTLKQLLNMTYEQFTHTFYLAQRELITQSPHAELVNSIFGVKVLKLSKEQMDEEIENLKQDMVDADTKHIGLQEQLHELAIEPDYLPSLKQKREELNEMVEELSQKKEELEAETDSYIRVLSQLRDCRGRFGKTRFYEFLLLIIGAILASGWYMLNFHPENPFSTIVFNLLSNAFWKPSYLDVAVYISALLGFFAVLLWARGSKLNRQCASLKKYGLDYAERLRTVVKRRKQGRDFDLIGHPKMSVTVNAGRVSAVLPLIKDNKADSQMIEKVCRQEIGWIDEINRIAKTIIEKLNKDIDTEEVRVQQANQIENEQNYYQQAIDDASQGAKARAIANQLLEGCIMRIVENFNKELKTSTGDILPNLTNNRYRYIKLDENLDVEVFSAGKGDFLEFHEVSTGTQRQMLLAVRISISQVLARDAVKGNQFMFLDEPFAFFDQERTYNTLTALHGLDYIPQVWVVSQEFKDDAPIDKSILCQHQDILLAV